MHSRATTLMKMGDSFCFVVVLYVHMTRLLMKIFQLVLLEIEILLNEMFCLLVLEIEISSNEIISLFSSSNNPVEQDCTGLKGSVEGAIPNI